MIQTSIAFAEKTDIPKSHLYALRVCNSGTYAYKQSFYNLKSEILKKFGHEADYDLQTIKQRCHSCNGTGRFKCSWKLPEVCWSCMGDGIFKTKQVLLKRYILNGTLFHEPVGELYEGKIKIFNGYDNGYDNFDYGYPTFTYESFHGIIVNKIEGLIKHEPMDLNPTWAYYYLLWNYNRNLFYKCIDSSVRSYQTRTQNKIKRLLKKYNPLKAFAEFFEVKKEQLEPIDDLPF